MCVTSSWNVLHSSTFLPQSKVYSVQARLVSGKIEALVTRLLPSPLYRKWIPAEPKDWRHLSGLNSSIWHCLAHWSSLQNMSKTMPYLFTRLLRLLLRDRRFRAVTGHCFRVHIGNDTSSCRPQRNGLSQRSVLAPILFNLYSNDLPVTRGRKSIYADDICLAIQGQYFSELECSLSALVRYGANVTLLSTVAT